MATDDARRTAEDDAFARAILNRACAGVAAASALGILTRFIAGSPLDAGLGVGLLVLSTCALAPWLARRGRVQLAVRVFLSIASVCVVGISVARGPSYPATIPLYLLLILLAGLLASSRAAILQAAFATLASTALLLADAHGKLPPAQPIGVAYRSLTAAVVIVVVTVTVLAGLRRLRGALAALAAKNIELEAARASLAAQVEERTRSLVTARDAAESASRTKTAFLANMSHELRTPMNAVLGSTDVLLATELGEEQRALVRTIREGGDALLSVLNDVLDLSAVEGGRLAITASPFEPRQLAAEAIGLLQPEARRNGLRLDFEVDADVPVRVDGDARRVRQVLLNLVGNAVKFTEQGVVVVRVTQTNGRVSWAVQDTGVGIAPDDHERIFMPFMQLDASSTRRRGGIGLGLAISRELAHLMGGDLKVQSAPGQGSTFTFEMPCAPAHVVPPAEVGAADPPPLLRILVAEDNEVNVRVLTRMLAHLGYRADVVGTGAAALAAAERNPYDTVLMDVHMPEMDGLEAMRRIRAEVKPPPVLVAVTADALPEQAASLIAAGFDDVMTKPVLLDSLRAGLVRAAGRRQKTGDAV